MSTRFANMLLVAAVLLLSSSCGDNKDTKAAGPILLGDSTSIVTETDPQKLKDLVQDLEPEIEPVNEEPADEKPAADTQAVATATTTPAANEPAKQEPAKRLPDVAGLKAEFKEVAVLIPNLNAKLAGRGNLQRANGAVFTYGSGNINGNQLRVSGNVTKVSMRYQTAVVLKNEHGEFLIDQLSTTTDWEPMNGNGTYQITGLDTKSLEYTDAGPAAIRNAVTRALQRRRLSRRKIQDITDDLRRVRSANQKPLTVALRSVMWKIDGKDDRGRSYSKQVRLDIPL